LQLGQELEAKQSLPSAALNLHMGSVHPNADRKLMTPEMIARFATLFHLPEERTEMHVSRCMQTQCEDLVLTIVIGDIHGRAAKLENLLGQIDM